ncbi:protein FAM180A [Trichomycterus rosablanca]|uniref:protein FAM180A n=1 Tax=Trichomycterus rosablanca TaxID=2290929 RepID=UPI002F34FC3A
MASKPYFIKFIWLLLYLMVFRHVWHPSSGVSAVQERALITSVSDANLVYEFMLSGLAIDEDNNVVMLDEELASMKRGRVFLTLINDHIPKTTPAMEQLLVSLEEEEESVNQDKFEMLILGIIYSAYQVRKQKQEILQQAWAGVLERLMKVTLVQIRKT